MKKRINVQFLIVVSIAIIVTAAAAICIFYNTFKREIMENLKTTAYTIKNISGPEYGIQDFDYDKLAQTRITVVRSDGTVVFDNVTDASSLENHGNRPEIKEAFSAGEGSTIRKSDTVGKSNFYFALKISDDCVVRVAREASSIWHIFLSALPAFISIVALVVIISVVSNHFLTRSFIAPIEQVANNLDNLDKVTVYKEMQPFVTTIKKQHDDIIKNAIMRQEFTANVSHELKTPLTAISGYSELIKNGMAGSEDIGRFANEIYTNANRLLTLINDIINLSELDRGAPLEYEDVDISEIAGNCVSMLDFHAKENQVTLHFDGEKTIVRGNKNKLEEVVYNLCDNAIRYNIAGGEVWVTVKNTPEGKILSVRDNGIGISKENQKRIFERFYRVDKSRSKKTGGTGLGLAIVKHIIEQHNFKIEVISDENIGTTINVIMK